MCAKRLARRSKAWWLGHSKCGPQHLLAPGKDCPRLPLDRGVAWLTQATATGVLPGLAVRFATLYSCWISKFVTTCRKVLFFLACFTQLPVRRNLVTYKTTPPHPSTQHHTPPTHRQTHIPTPPHTHTHAHTQTHSFDSCNVE